MKKSYKQIYWPLFLLLSIICCTSPKHPKRSEDSNQSNLNKELLLKQNKFASPQIAEYVVEIFEDTRGNLWFGTMNYGVARFDGTTLDYFSTEEGLCGKTVSSFAEDKAGNLWFGSHTGLCKYDGKNFTTVFSTTGIHNKGVGWISVQSDKAGNIWYSSNKGVFRGVFKEALQDPSNQSEPIFTEFKLPIDKEKITSYSITAGKASLQLEDKHGNLWFGTDGYGVLKFDGTNFTHFTQKDGLCSNNITNMLEDKNGNIWITCMQSYQPKMTGDGGLCRFDGNTFTKFPEHEGLHENDLYSIYQDKASNIWIGATGFGAYRYNGEIFTVFKTTERQDLTQNFSLQSILEDKNGILWFGFSGGLFRFNGNGFINVTQDGPWK